MSWLTKTSSPARALVATVLLVAPFLGCAPSSDPAAPRPNVLLVTLDTLRGDRLGSYGYHRDTSPFLDSLAAEGLLFTRAYSVSSWTVPSMASLFTGLYPESHGVAHGLVQKGTIFGQEVLSDEYSLLTELLEQAGYRTFGITASLHLASEFGFSQGFDHYENVGFASADKVSPILESMKEEILQGDGPYFLWLHLFDPHDPYHPRQPWIERYFPEPEAATKLDMMSPRTLRRSRREHRGNEEKPFARVLEFAQASYDSEINYTDRAVRSAFETLRVSPEDLIVITSDHGEEFLEHRDFGHAETLFEEQVRIPLIVRLPGKAHAGRIIEEPVSILDILPSLLGWLHVDPPEAIHGRSFLAGLEETPLPARPLYLSLSRPRTDLNSILVGDWKYIRDDRKAGKHKLFDLNNDPEERTNLVGLESARASELARELSEHLAMAESQRLESSLQQVPPETVERMRALGYVD